MEGESEILASDMFSEEAPELDVQEQSGGEEEVAMVEEATEAPTEEQEKSPEDITQEMREEEQSAEDELRKLVDEFENEQKAKQEEQQKPEGRANKTIRQLRARAQEAEQARQQENARWQQAYQQQQQQFQNLQVQMARLQGQMASSQQPQDPERQAFLDGVRKELGVDRFPNEVQRAISQQVEPLQRELQAMRQQAAAQMREEQLNRQASDFMSAADRATLDNVFTGVDLSEHTDLRESMNAIVMGTAHGLRQDPQVVAPMLRGTILKAAHLILQHQRNQTLATRKKNDAAAASASNMTRASNAKGNPLPSKDKLSEMGDEDYISYLSRTNPHLKDL